MLLLSIGLIGDASINSSGEMSAAVINAAIIRVYILIKWEHG